MVFYALPSASCLLQHSEISHNDGNVNLLQGWYYFYIRPFESSVLFLPSSLVGEANTSLF